MNVGLVDGRMLNISDYDSNNVLLVWNLILLTGIGVGTSIINRKIITCNQLDI